MHPKIVALDVSAVEPRLARQASSTELERLVETGDTLEFVGRLAAIVREPNGPRATGRGGRRGGGAGRVEPLADQAVGDAHQQQLAAFALVGDVAALLGLDDQRSRLDVDEEGAAPEVRRGVDDAARLPGARAAWSGRMRLVDLRRSTVERAVCFRGRSDQIRAVVAPAKDGWALWRARILLDSRLRSCSCRRCRADASRRGCCTRRGRCPAGWRS